MIQKILLALSFFTRLPIGNRDFGNLSLSQSAVAFPIAGAIIGALNGEFYLAMQHIGITSSISAWLTIFFGVILTGAMHEKGLAGSADAITAGQNRDEKLAVMRSRIIGTYGVIALIIMISLKANVIADFPGNFSTILIFIAASGCSHAFLAVFMRNCNYASREGILAANKPSHPKTITAITIGAALLFFTGKIIAAIIAIFILAAIYAISKNICERNFGGITSSTLGSIQQISEIAILLIFAVSG